MAPARELTLIRRSPAGTDPVVSGQFATGVRKTVAPAARAPAIFCWIPPIGSTVPLASISPVPAMDRPPGQVVRSDLVDDAEREHHARARASDVPDADRHVEREIVALHDLHADLRHALRIGGDQAHMLGRAVPQNGQLARDAGM